MTEPKVTLKDRIRHWILRLVAGSDVVVMNTAMADGKLQVRGSQGGYCHRCKDLTFLQDISGKPWWLE